MTRALESLRCAILILACAAPSAAAPPNGISPQSISLPSGPGSIEGLGESFEPQLNTGTGTYAVAIELPPGRIGFAPALGLSYNGGAGNGALGVGWSLAGLDHVQRQSDKGLPRYDASDTFVTGAGEELVPLSNGTWRAENEDQFRRFRFDAGANVWTAERPDGTALTFGAAASSRIESGGRTFRWMLTREQDTRGNRIDYEYVSLPGAPGMVYPARISYTRHASTPTAGEHVVVFTYEDAVRPDPVRDLRAGFEVVDAHRLRRIDVCTVGGSFTPESTCDDVGLAGAARVRAYELRYDDAGSCDAGICARGLVGGFCSEDADCVAGMTRLARVAKIGADGISELPPLSFAYTELAVFADAAWSPVIGAPDPILGFGEDAMADLNADGLPDFVETPARTPGLFRWWENLGPDATGVVRFAAAREFLGPAQRLSTPGTQLADLDGDGRIDLVTRRSPSRDEFDLYRGLGRGAFAPDPESFAFFGVDDFSPAGLQSPEVRLVDLDFDKRIDVMRTAADAAGNARDTLIRLNAGAGFLPTQSCGAIPGALFQRGKTSLVDLNGDRLLDVVTVETAADRVVAIRHYPATGRGGFGQLGRCGLQGLAVTIAGDAVAGVPGANFADFEHFFWQDLSNDGLADLLHLGPTSATAWVNTGGNRLERFDLGAHPDGLTLELCPANGSCDPSAVDWLGFADVNGNGTTDVVVHDRESGTTRFLDVVGATGVPPHLLRRIDNGIGKVVTIDYASSTADYVDARERGVPWTTRPPFPMTLVRRHTMVSGLDLDGQPGPDRHVTEYHYRDGYYDGFEREFRGFREAEQIERGDASQPTLVTRLHFHTGGPDGVDNDGDGLVDEWSERSGREEEPLKGRLLERRDEECSDGPDAACRAVGPIFAHEYHGFEVRTLYAANACSGDPEVGCCGDADCARLGLGSCAASGPSAFPATGSCVAEKPVRFPARTQLRRTPIEKRDPSERVDLYSAIDYDGYGNVVRHEDWGVVETPDLPPFGCLCAARVCSDDPTRACSAASDCPVGSCNRVSATDGTACTGDPFAHENPESPADERFVSSSYAANEARWIVRAPALVEIAGRLGGEARTRTFYDQLPFGAVDLGIPTRMEQWLASESRFVPRVRTSYDGFGNPIEILGPRGERRTFELDPAFRQYVVGESAHLDGYAIDASAVYHEGFGTPVRVTRWGIGSDGPPTGMRYDTFGRPAALVEPGDSLASPTRAFEYVLADPVSHVRVRQREESGGGTLDRFEYSDGLGRSLGAKAEGDGGLWILSGATRFNRRGTPSESWHPYFTTTSAYEQPDPQRARERMFFDALGRPERAVHPDGTSSARSYSPLAVDVADENDTAGATPGAFTTFASDGLGRLNRVVERNAGEEYVTSYAWDARDDLLEIRDSQGNRKRIAYDSLGRQTSQDDPDRGRTEYRYDDSNDLVETVDNKAQRIVYGYDLANRLVEENYLDTTGDPASDPVDVRYAYDLPGPAVALGDGTAAIPRFTAGQLVSVSDLAGAETTSRDERGRVEWIARRIADASLADPVTYTTRFAYDSLDRLRAVGYPDGDRVEYAYGRRGLVNAVRGGSGGTPIASAIDYMAFGAIGRLVSGNGAVTTYDYDDRLRLEALRVRGAGAASGADLLHYAYELDPASNILTIRDLRSGIDVPRSNAQTFRYDDLHRLTRFELDAPSPPASPVGFIAYEYDRIGNLVEQSSSLAAGPDLGVLRYGGAAGAAGRGGRAPGDPPGPHAVTQGGAGAGVVSYDYDDNGNLVAGPGLSPTWDFEDRLVELRRDAGPTARYRFDYADRRLLKSVTQPDGHQLSDHYPSRYFEQRRGARAVKYVYLGERRLAEAETMLDPAAERVQRIRLEPGWNLVALTVDAADAAAQLGLPGDPVVDAAYRVDPATGTYRRVDGGALPGGSLVWIRASQRAVRSVRGRQVPLVASALAQDAALIATGGLSAEPLDSMLPAETAAAWVFDDQLQRWQLAVPQELADTSVARAVIEPGAALYLVARAGAQLQPARHRTGVRFYHSDHLGSSNVVTGADGSLLEETSYYPYGEPRFRQLAPVTSDESIVHYAFTGKERDAESGLHSFETRFYAGAVGAFLSADGYLGNPGALGAEDRDALLRDPQQLHLYRYARNNPLSFRDPTGQQPESAVLQQHGITDADLGAMLGLESSGPALDHLLSSPIAVTKFAGYLAEKQQLLKRSEFFRSFAKELGLPDVMGEKLPNAFRRGKDLLLNVQELERMGMGYERSVTLRDVLRLEKLGQTFQGDLAALSDLFRQTDSASNNVLEPIEVDRIDATDDITFASTTAICVGGVCDARAGAELRVHPGPKPFPPPDLTRLFDPRPMFLQPPSLY